MSFVHRSLPPIYKRSKLEGFLNHRTTLINCRTIFPHLLWIPLHFNTKKGQNNNNNNFITLQRSLLPADCRLQYGILEIQAIACAVCAKNKQQFYKHCGIFFTLTYVLIKLSTSNHVYRTVYAIIKKLYEPKKKDSLLYSKCVVHFPKVNFVEVHKIGALQ